jgi:transcriptional regulator with XRE-family HTH domain
MPGQVSPLGERIDKRRAELGLKLREVAGRAGLSIEVLRAIRYGENDPRGTTMAAIDRALRWQAGSTERFLADGTEPAPLDDHGEQDGERRAIIAGVRSLYPGDTVAEAIMTQWGKPLEVRQRELDKWRATPGEQRALRPARNKRGTITRFR